MKTLPPLALLAPSLPAHAAQPDLLPVRQIGLELARDVAMRAIDACRQSGHTVSAVVLDRAGDVQAALRDSLAARHTLEIAESKAGISDMSGADSGEFRAPRDDNRPELTRIDGLIVTEVGLPIHAAAALKKPEDRLEFAM